MSFATEYNLPVFIGTGAVLQTGDTSQLTAGQIGIFDAKTYKAVSGPIGKNQAIKVAAGSWHTKDKLNRFVGGLKESDKTIDFLGGDILAFERSMPLVAQSEQWVLGWDGISDDTIEFQEGHDYHFKVKVWGEDVYGTFLRPVDRFIHVKAGCADPSDTVVPPKQFAKQIVDAINNDPELKYFVKAEMIASDMTAATATHDLWQLTVNDDGSQEALAAVQQALGRTDITRVSRKGIVSVYEFCLAKTESAPAAFTAVGELDEAVCGTCPAGYTKTEAKEVYVITRPLAGTENLVGSSAQQTFADAIKAQYFAPKTFNGASDVDPVTNQITLTGHGLAANTPVVYSNGGGTSITGLTSGNTYYVKSVVSANVITLSATPGGAVVDITADGVGAAHTLTVSATATFLSSNGAVATVKIAVDAVTADLEAKLSDSLVKANTISAKCVPPAGSSVAWVDAGERYKTTRTLELTLEKTCGGADRLDEIKAFYAGNSQVVANSITLHEAGTCNDTYRIQQYNNDCLVDGCLTNAIPEYDVLQSFDGFEWKEIASTETDTDVKVGVRVTAAYEDTKFGGCSFSPTDYYSVRPLQLMITEFDDKGNPCSTPIASRKTRHNQMPTQSGEFVIRQFIGSNKYKAYGNFYHDPRMREVLDANIHEVVDRNKFYKLYYLKVKQNRLFQNPIGSFAPEVFEFMFAFPLDVDSSSFETMVEKVTSQFGVYLQGR